MLNQLIALQMVGVDKYILGGIAGGDIKDVSYSANNDSVTYKLTVNKNYSSLFPMCTGAGVVNELLGKIGLL